MKLLIAFIRQKRIFIQLFILCALCACQKDESPASKILLGKDGLFPDVLELVHDHYVENVDTDKIVSGAINGALNTLDEFSNYYSEKDYKILKDFLEGQFGGIGAEVKMTKEGLEIIAPLEDGPASKAGILRGDLITHVDGIFIPKLTPVEILQKIHGKPGTPLSLNLIRQGEELKDIKVTRELVTDSSVKGNLEGQIAYIRVTTFNSHTADHLKEMADKLLIELKQKFGKDTLFQGVIIDLRNNPGGTLEQAVLVTSHFLDKGAIVTVFGKDKDLNRTFYSQGPDIFKDIPVAVLINKGSASASEVFSGALRDHKRAILIGEKTYGKGSVQRIFDLGVKGAVKITIAHFTTPEGHRIQGQGLEPDIMVQNHDAISKKELMSNESLPSATSSTPALNSIHDQSSKPENHPSLSSTQRHTPQSPPIVDYQKQRALDLLQGLSALNKW